MLGSALPRGTTSSGSRKEGVRNSPQSNLHTSLKHAPRMSHPPKTQTASPAPVRRLPASAGTSAAE